MLMEKQPHLIDKEWKESSVYLSSHKVRNSLWDFTLMQWTFQIFLWIHEHEFWSE